MKNGLFNLCSIIIGLVFLISGTEEPDYLNEAEMLGKELRTLIRVCL